MRTKNCLIVSGTISSIVKSCDKQFQADFSQKSPEDQIISEIILFCIFHFYTTLLAESASSVV